jgi:hypothetical protein
MIKKIKNFFKSHYQNGFWAFRYPDYTKHQDAEFMFGGCQIAFDVSFKEFRVGFEICRYMVELNLGFFQFWFSWPIKER